MTETTGVDAPSAGAPDSGGGPSAEALDLAAVAGRLTDIPLEVTLRFGECQLTLAEILELGPESVVELRQRLEDPVDLLVGGTLVGRGDVVVVEGRYGLRLTEILAGNF